MYTERERDIMAEIDPRPEPTPEPVELHACTYCGKRVKTVVTVNDADMGPAQACVECMALLEEVAQCA